MLTGTKFRLMRDVLALEDVDGELSAVTVPAGNVLKVAALQETGDGMLDVLWHGRIVEMFTQDVNEAEIIGKRHRWPWPLGITLVFGQRRRA